MSHNNKLLKNKNKVRTHFPSSNYRNQAFQYWYTDTQKSVEENEKSHSCQICDKYVMIINSTGTTMHKNEILLLPHCIYKSTCIKSFVSPLKTTVKANLVQRNGSALKNILLWQRNEVWILAPVLGSSKSLITTAKEGPDLFKDLHSCVHTPTFSL